MTFNHGAVESAPFSSIATAMLFGTVIFATACLGTRAWLSGDSRALSSAFNPRASSLDLKSYASVYTMLYHFSVLGLILFFAYICEYHPPFPHAEKTYDRDHFMFLTALLIFASAYTVHKNDKKAAPSTAPAKPHSSDSSLPVRSGSGDVDKDDTSLLLAAINQTTIVAAETSAANDVLNRDQTEEWKGWMQYVFLLYHYYNAGEVYNSIRIMITCYVWMTGFGNFSFFYLKADYSFIRVIQMLWRLNFLVVFLCLSQGTTYILYYICPLHTYFFLMVFVTMRVGKDLNYSKYGLRIKLLCVAILIFFLWDVDTGLFRFFHSLFLSNVPKLGATSGTMWEWYFRSTLDHWSTFLGMVFAANFPITSLFFRKLEACPPLQCWLGKGIVAAGLIAAFTFWVLGPFMQPKLQYNATNSYFGFIPMITYIYLRNLTPGLRSYSLDLLHQIGKTTLETYLMQHHIWLTSDAKSLLTLIPGWPKVNMLVVTVIYFNVSRRLYKLTLYLRGMLLPDDKTKCIWSLIGMAVFVSAFFAITLVLEAVNMLNLISVATVSMLCGYLLYYAIINRTWEVYSESSPKNINSSEESMMDRLFRRGQHERSKGSKTCPPVVGALVVLIVGMFWHGMAVQGAGKIQPLHAGCEAMVNAGQWVPIEGCNEEVRGIALRNYQVSSLATCNPSGTTYVWGWKYTKSSTHCRFTWRGPKNLKKTLSRRTLYFVGDSTTRNLYHSTCRSLGINDAGAYNSLMKKHDDIFKKIGMETELYFKWAPLAVDQLAAMKELNEKSASQQGGPDLIVMGGGAWDQLHLSQLDENQQSHRAALKYLTQEMATSRSLGTPVAWLVPTTINTAALNSEEKRERMREEDMETMRAVYADVGLLKSSSFVIDGPAFTKDRAELSYDGVHYPLHIYDAGAQILANAFDWLLPPKDINDPIHSPVVGSMSNPFLGCMMLLFSSIGLFLFDGFLGFSYLASFFVKGVMPSHLYEEAFTSLHKKMKLPAISSTLQPSPSSPLSVMAFASRDDNSWKSNNDSRNRGATTPSTIKDSIVDEEAAALIRSNGETEMKAMK